MVSFVQSEYRGPSNDEAKEHIKAWLLDFMARTGKTAADVARDLGVSEATISNIKLKKYRPGFTMLVRIHFAFGAQLSEVLRHPLATWQTKAPDHIAAQARK